MKTLVVIGHHRISQQLLHHGSELPHGLLSPEEIDRWLDNGALKEYPERRSLYALLSAFSGCEEKQPLAPDELRAGALRA
jgi:hypothetical protein